MRYYPDLNGLGVVSGRSDAAFIVERNFHDIENFRNLSITQATREKKLERIIYSLLSTEFSVPNWDCYGANPVKEDAISCAFYILDNLPKHIPLPDVFVETTGDIGMDWESEEAEFSSSVDENGYLSFACLSKEGEETFGSGKIINKRFLPKNFLEVLSTLY